MRLGPLPLLSPATQALWRVARSPNLHLDHNNVCHVNTSTGYSTSRSRTAQVRAAYSVQGIAGSPARLSRKVVRSTFDRVNIVVVASSSRRTTTDTAEVHDVDAGQECCSSWGKQNGADSGSRRVLVTETVQGGWDVINSTTFATGVAADVFHIAQPSRRWTRQSRFNTRNGLVARRAPSTARLASFARPACRR